MTKSEMRKERQENLLAAAKRKEILCPYSLRWFKVVKYASLITVAISLFVLLCNFVDFSAIMRDENFIGLISDDFRSAFTAYYTLGIILVILDAMVCLWRYKVLTYLPKSGYRQLIIGLIITYALGIISSASAAMIKDALTFDTLGEQQNTAIGTIIVSLVQSTFIFTLNFIYFRKRMAIFDEAMEYGDEDCEIREVVELCPHCGADVPDGQMFCSKCGKNLDYEN